jgi:hypothetical protein
VLRPSVAFLVLSALAACGEPPPRPLAPATAEDRFAQDLAKAACSGVETCCAARKLGAFDEPTCEKLVRGTLDGMQRLRKESGGGALDPKQADACLALVRRYGGSCLDPEQALGALDHSPCDELFSGGFAPGKPCQANEECAAPGNATRAFCGDGHTCEALRPAALGEACAGDCDAEACAEPPKGTTANAIEADCDARSNLTCDAATKTCRTRAAIDEPCDKNRACTSGAFCRAGKCAAKGALASSCADAVDACSSELVCDRGSKTCVAKKQNGQSCSEDADCATDNCAGRLCRARNDANMLRLGRGLRLFCASE